MPDPVPMWTPDLLYHHLSALMGNQERLFTDRIDSLEKSLQQSYLASEKAILKAETATERRLEGLNELRAMAEGRDNIFIPRAVAEAVFQQIHEKIAQNAERANERFDSLQQSLASQVRTLENRLVAIENLRAGSDRSLGQIATIIVLTGVIVGVVMSFVRW